MHRTTRAPFAAALALAACAPAAPPEGPAPVPAAAVAPAAPSSSAADSLAREVTALADESFAEALRTFPEFATQLGLPGFRHDRLSDNSLAGLAAWRAREDAWLERVRRMDADLLIGRPEWVTLGFLREQLESSRQTRACRNELWGVSQMFGWQTQYPFLAQVQPIGTDEAREQALARVRGLAGYIDVEIANLREGVRLGYTSPRGNVQRVLDQIEGLLAPAPAESPFASPAQRDSAAPAEFRTAFEAAVRDELNPALQRYRDYLRNEYLPGARETTAVSALPEGEACYRAAARSFSTLDVDPRRVHEIGLREMERIHAEMREIAQRSFGTTDIPALLARFRTDTQFTYRSREAVVAHAQAALDRARTKARPYFGVWPQSDVILDPYLPFEEASAPDSYASPSEDGSRPGRYRINTSNPTQKSRVAMESTAFHETIPGHHLQVAIAQERKDAHPITRFLGNSGYAEGWALYAERLADEIGMFGSDLDRLGMLSNEALRAARLVVDPGLHVLGWTRQQAIDYMLAHIAEGREEVEREVDRYIILPGQATSYMLGRLEIMELREQAKRELGPRFDIREFHDRVLEDGSLTLPMLRAKIERWIAAEKGR